MPYWPRYIPPAPDRFEAKVVRVPIAGCWLWNGAVDPNGYGRFRGEGGTVLAHRYAYELYVGPIPDGLYLCHRCDVPGCCNPHHMFIGCQKANMADASRKGRTCRGESRPLSKLTEDQVRAIKSDTRFQRVIAAEYGVHQMTVSRIKRGQEWSYIK